MKQMVKNWKALEELGDNPKEIMKEIIESGAVENAKPIYCHPINFSYVIDSGNDINISMLIFNNSAQEFTWNSFKSWMTSLIASIEVVRLVTTGVVKIGGTSYPANYLYASSSFVQIIVRPSSEGYSDNLSLTIQDWNTLTPRFFKDAVNKIN